MVIGKEDWVLHDRAIRPLVRASTFLVREWVEEPVNDVRVLIEVKLVILTLEFDGLHVSQLELIWVVLISPVEFLLCLLHVHMLEII